MFIHEMSQHKSNQKCKLFLPDIYAIEFIVGFTYKMISRKGSGIPQFQNPTLIPEHVSPEPENWVRV